LTNPLSGSAAVAIGGFAGFASRHQLQRPSP
jgi:hypothetical protein